MARAINKLTARRTNALTAPGRYSDGANLYLSISSNGGKRWVFFYQIHGRQREMGLGGASAGHVTLAEARASAADARKLLNAGVDPLADRQVRNQAMRQVPTFGTFADEYIDTHKSKFRNAKHIAQWEMTLKTYCQPIRSLRVDEIDTEAVLKVLQPIWKKIPETASRLRGRLENILDAAKAKGHRQGDNPARWRGHLKTLLPARQKLTRGHHPAMPYDDLPAFIAELRTREGLGALALELTILSVCRTSEVLKAMWAEFDLGKKVWAVPPERMKAAIEHRIPLSDRAIAILRKLKGLPSRGGYVFPGRKIGKPLSNAAMSAVLKRMGRHKITVHGFRSTFSDYVSEQTSFSHETREHALAHQISDKAEASYRRGDQFTKRKLLMEAWATYCEPAQAANVVRMRRKP